MTLQVGGHHAHHGAHPYREAYLRLDMLHSFLRHHILSQMLARHSWISHCHCFHHASSLSSSMALHTRNERAPSDPPSACPWQAAVEHESCKPNTGKQQRGRGMAHHWRQALLPGPSVLSLVHSPPAP